MSCTVFPNNNTGIGLANENDLVDTTENVSIISKGEISSKVIDTYYYYNYSDTPYNWTKEIENKKIILHK